MNYGKTRIVVCEDEFELGEKAASAVTETMLRLFKVKKDVNVVFAAGESQTFFYGALIRRTDIDWDRVNCFNMDEFWDRRMPEKFTCGFQIRRQLYSKVIPKSAHSIRSNAIDPHEEARRYESIIRNNSSMDILCQGIGTSGHLALNEPGQTNFNDKSWVRVVDIAPRSKSQLENDPNFRGLGYVPDKGITMTIPALLSAKFIFTIVPYALKRDIIERMLSVKEPDPSLPASILRTVEGTLFLDRNSCPPGTAGNI